MPWLSVIGIGEDGLDGLGHAARARIQAAELLVGGARHLALVGSHKAEALVWASPIAGTLAAIRGHSGRKVVVLASGDPMWFGIGAAIAANFAPHEYEILPAPSAFALAAARLGWALQETDCISLHGRPLARLVRSLAPGARILALANDGTTPAAVAELLVREGYGPSRMSVFEHLAGPGEHRASAPAHAWASARSADLNVIAIECESRDPALARSPAPGLPDASFHHDGQLTKQPIRAATLAALAPLAGALLWDIGAGSGAIGIEWCRAAPRARAIAIERDPERARRIRVNADALGVPELDIIEGRAPKALDGLEAPAAIFIGGGISEAGLIERCWEALMPRGILVANTVTVSGEAVLLGWHERIGGDLARLAISRAEPLGGQLGWRPLAPVTQLACRKPMR
jgi:precorrin-6Y C5,15-methyltransferase (decarboxylating)